MIDTPNSTYIGKSFQPTGTNDAYLHRLKLTAPAAATASKILAARTETALFLARLYSFTVTSANATAAAVYSDANGNLWTVVATISGGTTLVLTSASGTPPASGTLTKVSGTGDATITYSTPGTQLVTQPDFARVLSITGTGSDHDATGNVVITGTDVRGQVITDTIALNGNTTVNGVKAFKTVTSIDLTGVSALDANAGVEVGTTTLFGLTRKMDSNGVLLETVDGAAEDPVSLTVTYSTSVLSQNTVIPVTAPNGTHNYVITYVTNEVYAVQ
jgi:hypothetical protein